MTRPSDSTHSSTSAGPATGSGSVAHFSVSTPARTPSTETTARSRSPDTPSGYGCRGPGTATR
ncbi:hypothetical protein ADK56_20525 [Streptomyces sp. MMG1522]|nr:hypothetical protein ADK56_20525 [Streptomyces sp. MMG1522]